MPPSIVCLVGTRDSGEKSPHWELQPREQRDPVAFLALGLRGPEGPWPHLVVAVGAEEGASQALGAHPSTPFPMPGKQLLPWEAIGIFPCLSLGGSWLMSKPTERAADCEPAGAPSSPSAGAPKPECLAAKRCMMEEARRVSLAFCRKGGPAACRLLDSSARFPRQQRAGRASFLEEPVPAASSSSSLPKIRPPSFPAPCPSSPLSPSSGCVMETFPTWPLNPQETHKGPRVAGLKKAPTHSRQRSRAWKGKGAR